MQNLMRKQNSLLAIYVALIKSGMEGPRAFINAQKRFAELEKNGGSSPKSASPTGQKSKRSPAQVGQVAMSMSIAVPWGQHVPPSLEL